MQGLWVPLHPCGRIPRLRGCQRAFRSPFGNLRRSPYAGWVLFCRVAPCAAFLWMRQRAHQRAFRSPFGNLRVPSSNTAGLWGSLLKYRIVVQRHHAKECYVISFEALRVVSLTDKPVLLRATPTALPAGFLAAQGNSLPVVGGKVDLMLAWLLHEVGTSKLVL